MRLSLAEHYARLQAENVRLGGEFALLRRALDLTGTGFVLTDPGLDDNPIVYANESFHAMTGYSPREALGRNCRFLQGPQTEPERVDELRRAIAGEEPVAVELRNHRRDGSAFFNGVHVSPVRDARGRVVRFVGVQVDVTAYRTQERRFALEQDARRAAETAERRSAFLAAASPLLDASLDLRTTPDSLARLSVPYLGDVCLVDVVERREVQRIAAAAADPAVERLLRELPDRYLADPDEDDPRWRGGDFYDAFPSGDGLALVIGDVTGKGAAAASLTALSRHTLRTAGVYEPTPSGMLRVLNDALVQQRSARGKYCTVALAHLDGDGGAVVGCAGHPLPLVLRADGTVEQAGRPGTLLGWVADPRLEDVAVRLGEGDALVLYTDGLTEARTVDGLLGDERLAAILRGCAGMSAGAIAARLEHAAVELQRGRPRDDIAIAVARVR